MATVTVHSQDELQALGRPTVVQLVGPGPWKVFEGTCARAEDAEVTVLGGQLEAYGKSKVYAYGGVVYAYDETVTTADGHSLVLAYGETFTHGHGTAAIHLFGLRANARCSGRSQSWRH